MTLTRIILIGFVLTILYCIALVVSMQPWLMLWAGLFIFGLMARRGYVHLTAFGTARWADANDVQRAGMFAGNGLILGRMAPFRPGFIAAIVALFNPRVESMVACEQFIYALRKPRKPTEMVRLSKAVHTLVVAPTGVGKGVSLILPFLKTSTESAVVLDFKGENATLTADDRRKAGHRVVLLDPFRAVTQTPDSFNPLDAIKKDDPLALDHCRDLANALVVTTGQEKDPHFPESAKVWITAMIAVVVYYGEVGDRSLQTVRTLLSDPAKIGMAIELMCKSDAWGGMLSRLGHQLTNYQDKELSSTMTTTLRFLYFLDTLPVAESTKTSSFDPAELSGGKMTVYLILEPDKMRAQESLLRMWIGAMLRAVIRGGLQETNKVHFVLDEAASLGHLESLDDAVDKYRGYGVRLQFYVQSLAQLKVCFPEGQDVTLLSNTTQIFFGCNDNETAKFISERLGEETIVVASGGTGESRTRNSPEPGGGSASLSVSKNDNWAQQARKLLKPEEVIALSPRTAITFASGIPPLWTTLVRYFEEKHLGQEPGWFAKAWLTFSMLAWSMVLMVLAIMVAVLMTNETQKAAPNGSAQFMGARR